MSYTEAGLEYFLSYAQSVQQVLVKEAKIDVMIAPGNSGVIMADLFNRICVHSSLEPIHVIEFATYRVERGNNERSIDNRSRGLIDLREIAKTMSISNILVVDDEAGSGKTILACLKKTLEVIAENSCTFKPLSCVLITQRRDNFSAETLSQESGLDIKFYPYAEGLRIDDTNIIRKYFLAEELIQIGQCLSNRKDDPYRALNVALNVPVKVEENGSARFTSEINQYCESNIGNLQDIRRKVYQKLDEIIERLGINTTLQV